MNITYERLGPYREKATLQRECDHEPVWNDRDWERAACSEQIDGDTVKVDCDAPWAPQTYYLAYRVEARVEGIEHVWGTSVTSGDTEPPPEIAEATWQMAETRLRMWIREELVGDPAP